MGMIVTDDSSSNVTEYSGEESYEPTLNKKATPIEGMAFLNLLGNILISDYCPTKNSALATNNFPFSQKALKRGLSAI